MTDREEKAEKMCELVNNINVAIRIAEAFADKHNLYFRISPAYWTGGRYDGEEGEWNPSSQNC